MANLPRLLAKSIRGTSDLRWTFIPGREGVCRLSGGLSSSATHIHLLVKLAHWASPRGDDEAPTVDDEQLDRMVREAETALRNDPLND